MDVLWIFLYCLFSILQTYIMMSTGIMSYFRKIYTSTSLKSISEILVNFFLPIYAMIQIASISTYQTIGLMWILVVAVFISIGIGFLIAKSLHFIFNLDQRTTFSYPLLMSFPSLGTLALVLGKSLCFPGGPLNDDHRCSDVLGFMMMNYLTFRFILFVLGFTLITKDANLSYSLHDKMSRLWPILVEKIFKKDFTVDYLFGKYINNKKLAKSKFDNFTNNFNLIWDDNDKAYKLVDKNGVLREREMDIVEQPGSSKELNKLNTPSLHNEYFDEKEKAADGSDFEQVNEELSPEHISPSTVHYDRRNFDQQMNNPRIDEILEQEVLHRRSMRREDKSRHSMVEDPDAVEVDKEKNDVEVIVLQKHNDKYLNINEGNDIEKDIVHDMDVIENKMIINERRKSFRKVFSKDLENYYSLMFKVIEEHLDSNKKRDYELEKTEIMKNLLNVPPEFPIVYRVMINRGNLDIIEKTWEDYDQYLKKLDPNYRLTSNYMNVNINLILSKIYSPVIVGCILGLIIGLSYTGNILFSTNHYISNLVDGIWLIVKANVPILYLSVGISIAVSKGMHYHLIMTKTEIVISFIIRFVIMPGLGILYIHLWKTYYGGIVLQSTVFRIAMFMPFCLPAAASAVVVVNLLKFFSEETGFILLCHNLSLGCFLTVLYMIYFITVGSYDN